MARIRFTNQIAAYAKIVWPVDGFSSNGELCLNCLSHSRGQVLFVPWLCEVDIVACELESQGRVCN